jgi:hypothetical protein
VRYRDVEKRLRDLERHYHEDEAGEDVPDADVLSDDEVLQIALSGVRSSCLRFDGFAQCGLTPLLKPTSAEGAYWQRIGERASVLCAERNLVLIVLTSYEAQDAITALEQGLLKVYDFNTFPGCQSPRHFTTIKRLHIIPPWQHPERDRLWTLASVLHRAMCTWEDQVGEVPFTPNADSVLAWLHLVAEKIG